MQQPSSQSCDVIYLNQMEMLLLMNVNGCYCVGYLYYGTIHAVS